MNMHLPIRPILTAAALVAVIGTTSAISIAQAGQAGFVRVTKGTAGPTEPSPFIDDGETLLPGINGWNARAGWAVRTSE